jgi:hypothetical protein
MKQEITRMVKQLAGHEFLYLETALVVKKTPHSYRVNVWAVCVSPRNQIFLMDDQEQWFELEEKDVNHPLVIATLYQRVSTIYKTYQAA